jgi:tetratricopeptide (TPR) repeat protein
MLDPEARKELRTLARETADLVARHLVVTGQLLDEDPDQALVHARAARAMAGRVGVVREAAGLAAYAAGEWAEALAELRAARRITGSPEHLAVMADCERALGRPERALGYADDPDVARLTQDQRVELVIVVSGARRDLGQADAAVLALQDPAKRTSDKRPWAARLWYAYADALLDAGRSEQAREWFGKAAEVDAEGATDAGDRALLLDGFVLEDLADEDELDGGGLPSDAELAEYVRTLARQEARPAQEAAGAAPSAAADEPADEPVVAHPPSGVLAPPFAEPTAAEPAQHDRSVDAGSSGSPDDELRLFD